MWESSSLTAASILCTTELFIAAIEKIPAKTPIVTAMMTIRLLVLFLHMFFQAIEVIMSLFLSSHSIYNIHPENFAGTEYNCDRNNDQYNHDLPQVKSIRQHCGHNRLESVVLVHAGKLAGKPQRMIIPIKHKRPCRGNTSSGPEEPDKNNYS